MFHAAPQAIYRGQKGRERAAEIKAQQRKDAVLRAQEERLQAKVEEELRRAGAGAGARCGEATLGAGGSAAAVIAAPFSRLYTRACHAGT